MLQTATSQTAASFDLIIIGAGPAGLSFAASLANTNLRLAIIDPATEETLSAPEHDGREIALTHKSKSILQNLGAWHTVPADGIYLLKEAKVVNSTSPFELHFPTPSHARGQPTDTLGYLISNHHIRAALYAQVKKQNNVTWFTQCKAQTIKTSVAQAEAILDNGEVLQAQLLVAADSRFSTTRQQMGIPVDMHVFGRTVVVFRFEHTQSNQHTAFECFHDNRKTLAILPLTEYLSGAVITIDTPLLQTQIMDLSDEALGAEIAQQMKQRLGKVTKVHKRHCYPLVGVHAQRFYDTRFALIGDAAVGMHPVTAHGFNLGLTSQAILAGLIQKAHRMNEDIGKTEMLQSYSRQHSLYTRPMYHGTNFVVKLFTNDAPPAKLIRNAVLRISNAVTPIKKAISWQLTG